MFSPRLCARKFTLALCTICLTFLNPFASFAQVVETEGCTYLLACNYNPEAATDNGSCIFPEPNFDCDGNCLLDLNNNGLCDLEEVAGCTNLDAVNYNAEATLDDGTCVVTC